MPSKPEVEVKPNNDRILGNRERLRFLMDLNGVPKWLQPASFKTLPDEPRTKVFIWRGSEKIFAIPLKIQKESAGIFRPKKIPDKAKTWLTDERNIYDIPSNVHDDKVVIFMLVLPHNDVQPQYEVVYHPVNTEHLLMTPKRLEEQIATREYASTRITELRKPLESMRFAHMILTGTKSDNIATNLNDPIPLSEVLSPNTHFQSEQVINVTTAAEFMATFPVDFRP
jgi:hypothetical protein